MEKFFILKIGFSRVAEEFEGKEQPQPSPAEHLPMHTFVLPFTTLAHMEISLQKNLNYSFVPDLASPDIKFIRRL